MKLANKVALVTGAGGGLGSAIARRLASEGASVLCTDMDLARADAVVAQITDANGTASSLLADVCDPQHCEHQVAETVKRYGRIDVLINNAGVAFHRLALDTALDDWERILRINLTGSFLTAQAAARHMVSQGGGRIVQLGSISGQRGNMGGIAYGASKAAVMHVCKVLAVELSGKGVMVNTIAPGPIRHFETRTVAAKELSRSNSRWQLWQRGGCCRSGALSVLGRLSMDHWRGDKRRRRLWCRRSQL